MKSCYILTIATLAVLNSCGSMSEAIYYNDGTRKGPLQSPFHPPFKTVAAPTTTPSQPQDAPSEIKKKSFIPPTTTPPQPRDIPTNKKEPKSLTTPGPFIQPDVFNIPNKSELKETETTTHLNQSKPGLTVPQR